MTCSYVKNIGGNILYAIRLSSHSQTTPIVTKKSPNVSWGQNQCHIWDTSSQPKGGVVVDPSKIESISSWPMKTTIKQL